MAWAEMEIMKVYMRLDYEQLIEGMMRMRFPSPEANIANLAPTLRPRLG